MGTQPSRDEIAAIAQAAFVPLHRLPADRRQRGTVWRSCGRANRCRSRRRPIASGKVGTNLPRYSGHDAVLGDRKFIDDMTVPGMLYGALRLADHPRATVLAIDATAALAMPGVHRVVTAADVPGERYVGLIEKDWPVFVAIGEETRCTGDVIAGVVADTQRLARAAAEAIVVKYDVQGAGDRSARSARAGRAAGASEARHESVEQVGAQAGRRRSGRSPSRRMCSKTRIARSRSSTCFWSPRRASRCRSMIGDADRRWARCRWLNAQQTGRR